MAVLLSNAPQNFTEYPNSFRRQGAYPLEYYSTFKTLVEAQQYAKTDLAYVGQPFSVSGEKEGVTFTEYYVVANEEGILFKLGDSSLNADEINSRLETIEKFFADFNNLDSTLDTLSELQKRIKDIYDIDESDSSKNTGILAEEIKRSTAKDAELQGLIEEEARIRTEKQKELQDTIDNLQFTEEGILLNQDLYTYVNIGKITGASNTSPKKVASKGDTLKTVFNNVFGTQQDQQPTIITSNVKLNVNAGATSYGGGEYGTSVKSTDVTITFTLANSGTTDYGYRCGDIKTTGNQTFYYPVTKQNDADIRITLPSDQTATSGMVTAGTYVSHSNNVLYCNFNSSKQVSIKISLPAGEVSTSLQTRYGQISAAVTLGAAQKENQLTTGTAITKFLTYLGNDATNTSALSGGDKSNTAGSYTISAGSYYPYYLSSEYNSLTSVTSGATKFTSTSTSSAVSITLDAEKHIWFLLPPGTSGNKTIQYEALGQWYSFDGGTSGPTDVSLKLNSGVTVVYKGYCTNKKAAKGTTSFKIV